ncbi:FYVE, RhoGEF and PH domain-containing protein 3-like isoform X1 [Pectinophora gossypiella]|uniref:DH domain-containing protein n=1 Tax=Pectinophora gossypiella TaxID=13191 RepID=A0A1E1W657_PECGO|nr:FYVE, RhoGEF and PH domain-containing protein 3-like isoform X1 [Pectinophora gossypiella]
MTHEDCYTRLNDELHSSPDGPSEDEEVLIRSDRASVKEMILRFERTAINNFGDSSESLERLKDLGNLTSAVNPVHVQFNHLSPVTRSQDRNSNVSVNSILSNVSEISYESSSSGFVSDRKSDYPVPHRPAPPPPAPFNDSSPESKSPPPEEDTIKDTRRFSFTTPCSSPVVLRRTRQPPVIRRKSLVGSQGHVGETHWSYGVRQSDLEKLLRLKRSEESEPEEEPTRQRFGVHELQQEISSSDDSDDSEKSGQEYVLNNDDGRTDTMSTDHSTDTLINEEESDVGDNLSVVSGVSGDRSNYDNVSIKSVSSFDMVPYQKYDSITVSSDEFGSEVCHAPDTEFLTVSAVNEWCVSKSVEPVLMIPVESKKEKYRRRLTERVNELLHTENVYVERLRHVIENYIPEMSREDIPPSLRGCKPDIFANIERIHRFHADEFLPAMRDCENDLRKLGQCFRRYEQRFNMYVMYSRNNKRATRLVFEHKQFFQEKQLELGDRLDLSSYLLEPVQRIPRYKLFLDDLVKTYLNYENERCESDSRISKLSVDSDETGGSNGESSDNDETPLESLKLAKTMVECVLTAVDGIMALENIRDCPPQLNLLNQGRLLRQNEFFAMDPTRRRRQLMRIFLFDKLVLITVVYKKQLTVEFFIYKDHIPVDDLGITAKEHDNHKFTIWYKKRNLKSYKLETREPNIRNSWVEEITSLLWEQAMQKKELLLQERKKRISMVSMNSQESGDDRNDDKYNSLRGVPGEVRRAGDKKSRRTTWYCE